MCETEPKKVQMCETEKCSVNMFANLSSFFWGANLAVADIQLPGSQFVTHGSISPNFWTKEDHSAPQCIPEKNIFFFCGKKYPVANL